MRVLENILMGKLLKSLRGSRSKEEIAFKVGITVAALINYETGLRMPRDDVKIRLANFYGLTVQELFYSEQGKKKSTCL